MKNPFLVLFVFLFAFYSCKKETMEVESTAKSTLVSDLVNKVWVLEHWNQEGTLKVPPTSFNLKYIQFSGDSTFLGYTGCNYINGVYHANDTGGIFFFSLLNINAAPCPTGTGEWHDIMSDQLLAAKTFYMKNRRLKIVASGTDTIDQLSFIPRNL